MIVTHYPNGIVTILLEEEERRDIIEVLRLGAGETYSHDAERERNTGFKLAAEMQQ